MGLDMYLYCNSRTLTQRVHEKVKYDEYSAEFYRRNGIVMYWRKANAIHKWFVDNVNGGTDDCGCYEVSWNSLMELHDLCERVLERHDAAYATEELPPTDGFFFGSIEIDEWYWEDLRHTVSVIEAIRDLIEVVKLKWWDEVVVPDERDWCVSFQYRSSW